ncbi:MAG TPA: hypothetical protein PLV92_27505, partial [Pirellulaceae bacterium]|nr:hypothetical protein [Pirellulaceae bacterium]
WKIREIVNSGWTNSYPTATDANGRYHSVTVTSSGSSTGNNFGNWAPGTISGLKFKDLDNDGQPQEGGEPGLSGWTIWVDYDNDNAIDVGEPSAVTGAGGTYSITGVKPGTHTLREDGQTGWVQKFPASGTYSVTMTSQGVVTGKDFGNYEIISITGQKYADLTNVGVKDGTDPGLQGWKIELFQDLNNNGTFQPNTYVGQVLVNPGPDGDPVYTTYTNSSGMYDVGGYAGLTNGTRYFIRETNQQGFQQISPASVHSFVYNSVSLNGFDFGNQPCGNDTWNIPATYTPTITAPRVGILTVQLEGGGPGASLTVSKNGGGSFRYYTGLSGGVGASTIGATATGLNNPYQAGSLRADLIVDTAGSQYTVTVTGAAPGAKIRWNNSVNVDVQ